MSNSGDDSSSQSSEDDEVDDSDSQSEEEDDDEELDSVSDFDPRSDAQNASSDSSGSEESEEEIYDPSIEFPLPVLDEHGDPYTDQGYGVTVDQSTRILRIRKTTEVEHYFPYRMSYRFLAKRRQSRKMEVKVIKDKEESNETYKGNTCCVCTIATPNVIYSPCNHEIICMECHTKYANRKRGKKETVTCPVCRAKISSIEYTAGFQNKIKI
jgi:hypothetical protein